MENLTYEQASKELEQIVAKLESGTLAMQEAGKLFDRGQELVQFCYSQLNSAKGKLTTIKEQLGNLIEE